MLPANIICPHCGHSARRDARFCGVCGAGLPSLGLAITTTVPLSTPPSATTAPAPKIADSAALPPAGPFQTGMLLGPHERYRIERTLGKGGFGQAYLAYDIQLGRKCVVKRLTIDPNWSDDTRQHALENFEREARLLVTLNTPGHPNIPEIYEYLAASQCLVMKYIAGQSLLRILKRRVDPLPEPDALRYIRDVCSALVYMHSRTPEPVLHRDIKPDNILLDSEGRIWVIDFGLSKAIPAQAISLSPYGSQAAGTIGYAPLEQWQGAAEPRSDVYALAATLYTLLTNRQPDANLGAMLIGLPPALRPVRQFNPDVRPEVEHLIGHGMANDISARPSAQGFMAELEALLDTDVPPPPPPKRPPDVVDFVGRAAELSACAQRLATTHVAVITGMAGAGKTTLAAVLARQVASPDKLFWHPFHQAEGIDVILWELAAFLAWHGKDDLWRLMHTARRSDGKLPPELLLDYLIQLIRGQGYLLCFDDFQFVDDDPLLNQLVERLRPETQTGAVALIVASRRAPAFAPTGERELLAGLSADDTRDLLAQRGMSLPDQLVADLFIHTGGNAQFLTLSIAALQRATDPARLIASLPATADIEQYLLAEVDAGLTDGERVVMSAVAILLGYGGTRDAIETILDGGSASRTLNDLSSRHLLTLNEGNAGREYRQHAIVQAFYYNLLSRRERQALHRRAGDYYEREEPDVLKAASHFERAGEHTHAAVLATADIWALINQGQARPLRSLLEQFSAQQLDTDHWVDINIARGEVYMLLGEQQAARESYTEAFGRLAVLPDSLAVRERKARVCRGIGESLEHESPQKALEWLHRGLDELAGDNVLEEAFLRFAMGSVLIGAGENAAATHALEASLRLLPETAGDWRARALMNLGVIHCSQGDLKRGQDYFSRALAIYQQTHNDWRIAAIRQNLGLVMEIGGKWAGAVGEYRQALGLAERLGDIVRQAEVALTLGNLYVKQGDIDTALAQLSTCLTLVRRHTLREQLVYVQASLANAHIQLEAWDEAETALVEAERTALETSPSHPQLPEIYRSWAQVRLARGQPEAALADAERSVRRARELEASLDEGMGLRALGQVLLAVGRRDEALEAFAQSLALLDDSDPYEAARTRVEWGRALASGGDQAQGMRLLHEARARFQELGAKDDLAAVEQRLLAMVRQLSASIGDGHAIP